MKWLVALTGVALAGAVLAAASAQDRFSFRTSANLVNVSVTVTDANGRFVPNLRREDFVVLEDGVPQPIAQFENERVPVSLGLALDTSGSMAGDKILAAQNALHRFLFDLLDPQDEVFLYRFDSRPDLVRGWTTDRASLGQALGAIKPFGGTAIYDTLAEAVPLTATGTRRKKALVLVSDGQDTSSHTTLAAIRQLIRESEVLVYAVGIDADGASPSPSSSGTKSTRSSGAPVPSPFPGRPPVVSTPTPSSSQSARGARSGSSDRVNADALREITDDSGGRTEVIRSHRDLDPATASIADELRRQYFLGYASTIPKDGRWHTIEVQLVHQKVTYRIRSRRGFVAS